ncbi:hypothetical protein HYY69_07615 [Candidatus Woesearchaeota archaeon]|nr:hypothetical protein [Candidatus Woesearchaeota archaeon]
MAVTLDAVLGDSRKYYEGRVVRVRCSHADGWKEIDRFKQHYLQQYHELLLDAIYDTALPRELRFEAWRFYSCLLHRNETDASELTAEDMNHMFYFQNRVQQQYALLGRIKRYSFERETPRGPLLRGERVEHGKIGDLDVIIVPPQDQLPQEDNVVELIYTDKEK